MSFSNVSIMEVERVMEAAAAAFPLYKAASAEKRAVFLDAIAGELELLGDALISQAAAETNLPVARLEGERARTAMQLRSFSTMLSEGSWQELSIDTALPDRQPIPKKDIRKMLVPMGPVVVFGASNFPLAYSTAGGDTASALAAGCVVVVKGHPAHAATSAMVAAAIDRAAVATGMPAGVFQHVMSDSFEVGKALVQHPATAAVGFTGSFSRGKALFEYAQERTVPIPVFAEMGSVNPVLLMPDSISSNSGSIAHQFTLSITNGVGQFCTKPGVFFAVAGESLDLFVEELRTKMATVAPTKMLHAGIFENYSRRRKEIADVETVQVLSVHEDTAAEYSGTAQLAIVSAEDFIMQAALREEVFGPFALIVRCRDVQQAIDAMSLLKGQLTVSLIGTDKDFEQHPAVLSFAESIAGRVVINDIPTGVEVCGSMVHGGPYPSTTDGRFTSVGVTAVKRWVRPVCYQNFPEHLLPVPLRNANPKQIMRLVNNQYSSSSIE